MLGLLTSRKAARAKLREQLASLSTEDEELHYKPIDYVIGGWKFGSVMVWQSGAPFSILSSRGTINRVSRSYYNTAVTPLTGPQLAPNPTNR